MTGRRNFWIPLAAIATCAVGWGQSPAYGDLDLDDSNAGVVQYIMEGWSDAQGGAARLALLRNAQVSEEVETNQSSDKTDVSFVTTSSGLFRQESRNPVSGTIVEAFDGRIGWKSQSQWGLGPMPASDLKLLGFQANLLNPMRLMDGYTGRRFISNETLDDRLCRVVGMTTKAGTEERWFFDRDSRQLVEIDGPLADGAPSYRLEFFDFRTTGEMVFPYGLRFTEGKWVTTVHRTQLAFNAPLDESIFELTMEQLRELNAVEAILERQGTISGATGEALSQIRTRVIHLTVDSMGVKAEQFISQKAPNLICWQFDQPGMGRTLEGYDGEEGWFESDVLGFHKLESGAVAQLRNDANSCVIVALGEGHPFRKLLGERRVNGRLADAIAMATLAGPDGTYYFDRETGRLVRHILPQTSKSMETVIDFTDFQTVDGIETPFVTTINNPAGQSVVTIRSIANNVPLDDSVFIAPAPSDN